MLAEIGAGSIDGAVRADPCRPPPAAPARPAAGAALGGRAEAPPAPTLLRRNRTASATSASSAPAAGSTTCRRCVDEIVGRYEFADHRLGLAAVRLRPQPGLVRVCQPARRAGRHGGGRRCRSTPGAVPPATPSAWRRGSPAGTRCCCRGIARSRATGGDRAATASRAEMSRPHRHGRGRPRSGDRPARPRRSRAPASPPAPPRSISRARPISALIEADGAEIARAGARRTGR